MSQVIKPITSDHDLIELAERLNVHLDDIFESSEITKPLLKKGTYLILLRQPDLDVGHWQAVHDGEFFDSMGEAAPTKYGIGNTIQSNSRNTGKLSLTADQVKGSGSVIHLHPASYEKAIKARKAGRGVRLDITRREVKKGYKRAQGGSVWSKIWGGIKSAFKFAKKSGLLTQAANAAVPAIATALGAPQAAIPARAIRSMTGIGVYDSDSDVDKEGGRVSVADVKKRQLNPRLVMLSEKGF
ncbi:unnamed protein product [Phytophthora lilii]|uniref:Unnamed protein product n=1 Tax=Phytophthora lilii TaxID=2077276 RepID=A0A9W6X9G6_9STRA|nr:unnamed protein product [Phytophthora lilii]